MFHQYQLQQNQLQESILNTKRIADKVLKEVTNGWKSLGTACVIRRKLYFKFYYSGCFAEKKNFFILCTAICAKLKKKMVIKKARKE